MLKKCCALALSACLLTGLPAAARAPAEALSIRLPGEDAPVFEGWGTSLCWWANRVGYSDTLTRLAAVLFFGDPGLRLNILRYNIGGGDDPAHHHITRTDSEVPGWTVPDAATQTAVFTPEADRDQLNVLRQCYAAAGENALVEVFSNSPPWYMTVSGCSSGSFSGGADNLREDAVEAFADYLARVTAYIQRDLGIPVTSLSPMNEPDTDYWHAFSPKQEGCHFDAGPSQSRLLTACAQALKNHGLDQVLLAASDETDTGKQLREYARFSPQAKAVLGRLNTHTYGEDRMRELGALAKREGLPLWMSEVDGSGTAGTGAGEMGPALWLGQKIIRDLTALEPSAWVLWQVIDSHISSQGRNGNSDSGMVDPTRGFWGTAVADHDRQKILLTQKYYGFGQFTRYIRPGMVLIPCDENTLAAWDRARGTLVVVALNPLDREVPLDCVLPAPVREPVQRIRTSGSLAVGEHWNSLPDLPPGENRLRDSLKPNSVTTYVLQLAPRD